MPQKLIEVALPLEAINAAAAREKSIRHGHPSTLHLWWARRPLAAARAVIFAQLVDDPAAVPEEFPTEAAQNAERQRLFRLIEQLVLWENTTNETVLEAARVEIRRSWARWCAASGEDPAQLPPFHDPFAGGGALPLEAQRLGLEAHASDLNPVAVMINKAMIEIPPRFAGQPPVNPEARQKIGGKSGWKGAAGLAEDVRYYGRWMRDEAEKRIGHLYPKVRAIREKSGAYRHATQAEIDAGSASIEELTVIAWLWARTVKSPNPAFTQVDVPLISSYWLSTKKGKETWVEPVITGQDYHFEIRTGTPANKAAIDAGTKLGRGANFRCILSDAPISPEYIKAEGMAGRMDARLMAIVCEGERGRVYLAPTAEHEAIAQEAQPTWEPQGEVPARLTGGTCYAYGLTTWGKLFTARQLVALTTFSDLVAEACEKIAQDARTVGLLDDDVPFQQGGKGAKAYADAVSVYLAFAINRSADRGSTLCSWDSSPKMEALRNTFGRQAIPMVWDFAEGNPFSESSGNWLNNIEWVSKAAASFSSNKLGFAQQEDASSAKTKQSILISTDPPYYDNISYADLSDYFYTWLRRSLQPIYSNLFSTLLVPKVEELVASSYRHGSKEKAEQFFLSGMTQVFRNLVQQSHIFAPVTIYYAFKQSEDNDGGESSTGWETFLEAIIHAGFTLTGTWPMRTELSNRMIGSGANALASSIVLVCRPREADAPTATRREFLNALKRELPPALRALQSANIAPVDLAQASIGPGMGVFSRYAQVLEADGAPMRVRTSLQLINQTLDEVLAEQEGDFDPDTGWAVAWFDQFGFNDGPYGEAETLSKAKNTALNGLQTAGIVHAKSGRVRLLRVDELAESWTPATDQRLTVWEVVHHLIRALNTSEVAAAALVAQLGAQAEAARELAYRLYNLCERRKRPTEAQAYNALVLSWPEIVSLAQTQVRAPQQGTLV